MANDVTTQSSTLATVPASTIISTLELGGSNGHAQVISKGGNTTAAVASGTAGNTVVKATAALLARVLVTASNSNDMLIYDNASTASGTIVGVIPGNTPTGTVFEFHMPCANGIVVQGNANNPGVTIAYA